MWTLAAETSTSTGSLALLKNSKVHDFTEWPSERSHSEKIVSASRELLKINGLKIEQIDRFAVSSGPGSFTGIRVALNFVRALAYTFKKPVICVDSLFLLAAPAMGDDTDQDLDILCLQSAFRNLIYISRYKKNSGIISTLLDPQAVTIDETKGLIQHKTLVLGRAFSIFEPAFDPEFLKKCERDSRYLDEPHAKNFAFILSLPHKNVENLNWESIKPLYIRASEAEEKLRQNVRK